MRVLIDEWMNVKCVERALSTKFGGQKTQSPYGQIND